MYVRAIAAIAVIILSIPAMPAAGGGFLPPIVTVPRLTPTDLPDAIGSQPVAIPGFVNLKNKGMPTQQTQVWLSYDDESLYVAFRCSERNMDKLLVQQMDHDGPIWRDDSVDFLLDPDRDGKTYFHLVANSAGARFECRGKSPDPDSWNGEWSANILKEEAAWTAFIRIPFKSMGVPMPEVGTAWRANFGRSERPLGEISSWSPAEGGFREPEHFGQIIFGDVEAAIVSIPQIEISAPGVYPLTTRVSNPAQCRVKLRAETIVDGETVGKAERIISPGDSEWCLNLDFPYEGKHKLSFAFVQPATRQVIMRTPPVQMSIPPHRARLDKYREIVRGLLPAPPAMEKEMTAVRESLGEILAFARTAEGNGQKWSELGRELDGIEPRVAKLRYACADEEKRGYVVGTETPLRKILRHRLFEGALGESAKISACRNEYEAVQVVVITCDRGLADVSVSVSPLKGPDGAVIPADRIALNLVDYVKTRKPRYEVDYVGWWPDPLMDMRPFDVPAGGIQPVWITVHPAEDTPAGVYRGQVVLKPANAPETTLPIEVRVWDFALPKEPHLKTAFALFPHEIGAWYGGMTHQIRLGYYEFLLEHRINPTNIYSSTPAPSKEDLPFCAERGLNAFCLAYTHNKGDKERAELLDMLRDYESFLKEKGWWDKAYLYGFDEIPPEKYGELRDMYGWVKREFPDLPRMCTVIPNEDLRGYVDIWVPVTSNYRHEDAQEYTKAGDEVWWYVCCNPHHPYPNFFIDYPAIDPRILFWMNWKYRVPGFLYYAMNIWTSNRTAAEVPNQQLPHEDPAAREAIKSGKRWPEVPWNTFTFSDFNGDGQLIYPGPDGKPLSSIRLECIRDGIEDYEYFYLLNDLVNRMEKTGSKADAALLAKARKLLAVDDEVVESLTEYTLDPELILATRHQVAETIEKLSQQPAASR